MPPKSTLFLVERRDGKMVVLRSHDVASADRVSTALIDLSERAAIADYEIVEPADEGSFAGLTNKEHPALAKTLTQMLKLSVVEVERVEIALDEAF